MQRMTEGNLFAKLLKYTIPLILGNILQLTYNAVDSIVVGKFVGEEALAAVSAANPVLTIFVLGVSGISMGASVLMSQFFGAGENAKLKKELATTLLFGAACSVLLLGLGVMFARQILYLMNVPAEIMTTAEGYLRIIFVGFVFTFLYNIMAFALRSVGDSKTPMLFLGVAAVSNIGLDLLFVCVFRMGVWGAAWATVMAQGLSMGLCFYYVNRKIPLLKLRMADIKLDKLLLKETLKSGSITALQQSCQPIGKVFIQSVINAQGITAMAAFNAVCRVDDFACIPAQSIGLALMTAVAQNRGAGKQDRVQESFRKGMLLELCYFPFIFLMTLGFKTPIMNLFAPHPGAEMITIGVSYLSIKAFFFVMPCITNGLQGYFRGMGKMTLTLIATLIQITLRVIVTILLVPRSGISGEAYACFVGWMAMTVFEMGYYFIAFSKQRAIAE